MRLTNEHAMHHQEYIKDEHNQSRNLNIDFSKIIVEHPKEYEEDSNRRQNELDSQLELDSEGEGYDLEGDESEIGDDLVQISPANKVPGSIIDSRNSLNGYDMSSTKKSINIFCGSDNKFPDVNRSFQYDNNSVNNSFNNFQTGRNVSQKYLHSQNNIKYSNPNVLRERLTDPNNISNNRSNDSITISHHTMNQSNNESDKINISNLKHNSSQNNFKSSIDLEKVRF